VPRQGVVDISKWEMVAGELTLKRAGVVVVGSGYQ
jgi:hypothetical protein